MARECRNCAATQPETTRTQAGNPVEKRVRRIGAPSQRQRLPLLLLLHLQSSVPISPSRPKRCRRDSYVPVVFGASI
jgi:hypothetical protein